MKQEGKNVKPDRKNIKLLSHFLPFVSKDKDFLFKINISVLVFKSS